jgi:hypothetical protein
MPLSPPTVDREPIHTRTVTCRGHRRTDGLYDIEGHLLDQKAYGFPNTDRGWIAPGEPLHEMWLRLTVDETLVIKAVEAVTDNAPYGVCPTITPNFQRLVGLRIKGGFTQAVKERLGGVEGCTHLVELTGPVATTAYQTVMPDVYRRRREAAETAGQAIPRRHGAPGIAPALLNTCHAYAANGPVVKREYPDFYTGD